MTTMTTDNDCHYFFLAGDVGGTNTRLALYDHNKSNDNDDDNKNNTFKNPLFMREYLNEDCVATTGTGTGTTNKGNDGCDNNSNTNNNNHNFVRKLILPFLEECCEEHQLLLLQDMTTTCPANQIIICLGVAGPVDTTIQNGTVLTSQRDSYLTGLSGTGIVEELHGLDTIFLGSHYDVNCCIIINDFVAQGYGCLSLQLPTTTQEEGVTEGDDVCDLNASKNNNKGCRDNRSGPILCVGAGTGFGSCYLTPSTNTNTNTNTNYVCYPSEVGQIEWVPNTLITTDELIPKNNYPEDDDDSDATIYEDQDNTDEDQLKLWKHLTTLFERVAIEDVVSGVGISNAYNYYSSLYMGGSRNKIPIGSNWDVSVEYGSANTLKGKVIGDNYDNCVICKKVIDTIMIAYGTIVGSCAMSFLPTGGLFICGGIMTNHLDKVMNTGNVATTNKNNNNNENPSSSSLSLFMKAYYSKGRASFLLNGIPLYAVVATNTGLRGAAVRANMEYERIISKEGTTVDK